MTLAVLCLSLLIVTLDNTILNVVLPTLVRDMHASVSELQWIVDAYGLVFASLLLVAGSLADRIGRKRTYVAGLLIFIMGSTWAAYSGSIGMLIAARASMGVGAAMIMPSTLSIITTMFTDSRERQRAFGFWAGTSGVGLALGPIIGGLLLAYFWWGSVFLVNVPIVAVSLVCAIPLVPDSKNADAKAPDVTGSALSVSALTLLLWSVIQAPVEGWSSGVVIGVGLGGLAVLALFVGWERFTSHPMLHLEFFRSRNFSAGVGTLALVMFGGGGALFVLTQYLQFVLGYSALAAGIRVLPAAGMIAVTAPLSPFAVSAVGRRVTIVAGLLLTGGGLLALTGTTTASGFPRMLPCIIALGVGTGLVLPAATTAVMESLPRGHTGVGSATNSTFIQFGTALGVAVIGSMLSTRYQDRLTTVMAPYHLPQSVRSAILGSVGGALAVAARAGGALGRELASTARSAFIDGMDLGLAAGAAVALVAAVAAVFLFSGNGPAAAGGERDGTPGQGRGADGTQPATDALVSGHLTGKSPDENPGRR